MRGGRVRLGRDALCFEGGQCSGYDGMGVWIAISKSSLNLLFNSRRFLPFQEGLIDKVYVGMLTT